MDVVIKKEAKQLSFQFSLCSSMLSINNIVSWVEAIPEINAKAPCLSEMFKACVTNPQNQNVFAAALAVLMKGRWSHACFMQKIVSLILYMGHANKQVLTIHMNKAKTLTDFVMMFKGVYTEIAIVPIISSNYKSYHTTWWRIWWRSDEMESNSWKLYGKITNQHYKLIIYTNDNLSFGVL